MRSIRRKRRLGVMRFGRGRHTGLRVKAIGVDIVSTDHIKSILDRHPDARRSIFTAAEISYSQAAANAYERFAARFAAKEAVLKALGTGMAKGMRWTDIEVGRAPSGRPLLHLHGAVARRAALLGLETWLLSLSHGRGTTVAYVVACGQSSSIESSDSTAQDDAKEDPLRRRLEAA